ncbi:hypothetical protein ACLQ29_35540, partial [Micromonospora sp. DT228]|uniref:hypothetical protein n=1 Tax=Micromonospora sp. DT228 TaxID=3393443 RepID=UPI003CF60A5F
MAAERIDGEGTSLETIKQVTLAGNQLAAYRDPKDTMRVFGGEQPADRAGILARVDQATIAARAFPVSTRDAVAASRPGSDAAGNASAV